VNISSKTYLQTPVLFKNNNLRRSFPIRPLG
jgi:hypothetical protein